VIRPLTDEDIPHCATLLNRLPAWFGIPESNAAYIASLHELPGFVALEDGEVVGFVAVLAHGPRSAEISVMGVDPTRHRTGVGRSLVDAVESWCSANDVTWLHVKTRGPSTYDDDYEQTRRFYRGVGFEPLYESLTEWGPDNAALVLVKNLTPPSHAQ
jgi:GNAT superfamily N-acetyltransferase